jgi:class 3 adenylate cyclase
MACNEIHAVMGAVILKHEGPLERFIGDGLMMIFKDQMPARTRRAGRRLG